MGIKNLSRRALQEELARRNEEVERKRREEEERLRQEEEVRLREEEIERLKEEVRQKKTEREKERLLKRREQGLPVTRKERRQALKLQGKRDQFAGGLIVSDSKDASDSTTKVRPSCDKKFRPNLSLTIDAASMSFSGDELKYNPSEYEGEMKFEGLEENKEVESANKVSEYEVLDPSEESGFEEENVADWEARSLDGFDLKLPSKDEFCIEEGGLESELLMNEKMSAASGFHDSGMNVAAKSKVSTKSQILDMEKWQATSCITVSSCSRDEKLVGKASNVDSPPEQIREDLRSPICCVMGHVDAGKTKLLDCIRGTNVQEGEAGGITQQIGATYLPVENIRQRTKELKADAILKIPGLLVIDTPGHESFTNLRTRGSGLCDIAILVVDIMHGLEPQTIESLNLFIVALNKVDRLYKWKKCPNTSIRRALKQQSKDVQHEFNHMLVQIVTQFKEQGLNTELYYKNREMGRDTFSIVPTSAISGEGVPDLLLLLAVWTQKTMSGRLSFSHKVQCTILEVEYIKGFGTTINVVLVNGTLHKGDRIIVYGMQGPFETTIRALVTQDKGAYIDHNEIKAAQGIKIAAQGLEEAVAGTSVYAVDSDDDLEDVKKEAMEDMKSVMSRIDKGSEGVCIQACSLGSLEALIELLKTENIAMGVINIGPVHRKDVLKASLMLGKKKEYAAILAFNVNVTPEVLEFAKEKGVKIFTAEIIYKLFDEYKAYVDKINQEKKKKAADEAVFPCLMKPNHIFNKKDPIILGVDVVEGILRVNTPIFVPQRDLDIGRIASIECNYKAVDFARKGQKVAIKIVGSNLAEQQKMYGRHFQLEDDLVSHVTRRSVDVLKEYYKDSLSKEDWKLVGALKKVFKIR